MSNSLWKITLSLTFKEREREVYKTTFFYSFFEAKKEPFYIAFTGVARLC
jgi:hypothetical protein